MGYLKRTRAGGKSHGVTWIIFLYTHFSMGNVRHCTSGSDDTVSVCPTQLIEKLPWGSPFKMNGHCTRAISPHICLHALRNMRFRASITGEWAVFSVWVPSSRGCQCLGVTKARYLRGRSGPLSWTLLGKPRKRGICHTAKFCRLVQGTLLGNAADHSVGCSWRHC